MEQGGDDLREVPWNLELCSYLMPEGFLKIRYKYHSDGNSKIAPTTNALVSARNTLSGAAEFVNVKSGPIKNGNCASPQPAMMNAICAIARTRARR